ncbi:Tat pathway signal sequence domain protein [Streptomyces albus subsp. albus]|nr:Tat pathway signal sequence domain protein [Streptomyces albus subsp. albus]
MAEIIQDDGTWSFDGDAVRIVPGRDKGVHVARQTLGERAVPLAAVAGITYEPGRKAGRLRLRLREGADPLLLATGGKLPDNADPYQLSVEPDRTGVAEYFVDEVRHALLLEQVPSGPCDRFLIPGPAVPLSASAGDGTAFFDGEQIRLEWNWKTEQSKKSAGTRTFSLADLDSVEWLPAIGLENGYLRFVLARATTKAPPKYDPHSIELFGFRKDPLMALVAAAVVARMPHPAAPVELPAQAPAVEPDGNAGGGDDHDALLRRLRELGELRQAGVLTEEEFTAAKQSVLRRF